MSAAGATINGNVATWNVGTLDKGAEKSFDVVLTSKVPGNYCNSAAVSTAQGLKESAQACTDWIGVTGVLVEVVDDPDPIQVDEFTTFTLRVTNQGSSRNIEEIIVKAIRAGADELLSAMPTAEELLKALVKVIEKRRTNLDQQKKTNRIITFFSPHGGVGVTTTAINFALELKRLTRDEVVLVDLDLQRGESPVFLNFQPSYNILDVCEGIAGLDPVLMKGSLHSHASGLQVLAPPTNVEDCEAIQPDHVEKILNLLRDMYRWVVVDTGSHLNEVALVAMERANRVYLLCDNMVPTVRACQRMLDTLVRLGIDTEHHGIAVVNHVGYPLIPGSPLPEDMNQEKESVVQSVETAAGRITLPERPLLNCAFALQFSLWLADAAAPGVAAKEKNRLAKVATGPGYDCRGRNGDG